MHSATVKAAVEILGRGLFSGEQARLTIEPCDSGLVFVSNGVEIPALPGSLRSEQRWTVLATNGAQVCVVEHLLCALWAAGIDSARMTLDGSDEIPNIDGSSLPFYELVNSAGLRIIGERESFALDTPLHIGTPDSYVALEPADHLSISYHFSHPELGESEFEFQGNRDAAPSELLPARTFATWRELQGMLASGLMRNDDELAGLVIREGQPGQPLRFPDEYARHKVLDLIGDLYLLPFDWHCRVDAYRSGHQHNHLLSQALMAAYQEQT